MKKTLLIFLLTGLLICRETNAQSSAATLDVVSWNLEWFGDTFGNGPNDKNLQEANAKKVMRYLDADLYGLVEIVDTMRVRRLVDSLGNTEYGFIISPFCSNNTSGTGASFLNGQKLAFIYRKSVFSNVTTRGLMRTSSNAYTNWASGRFPFMLSATVTINSVSKNINFIVIHGKAGDQQTDYQRRQQGAMELKDTLNLPSFNSALNFIIGDFNDALNTSIYAGAGGVSSYSSIIADSTDADHYKSITLPLGNAGQASMINYPNVVDNHVISDEVEAFYFPGSAKIRTDITAVVPDYVTAHNTSDHYPVFSQYSLNSVFTAVPNVTALELGISVYPNPFLNDVSIKTTKTLTNVQLQLINMQGQVLNSGSYGIIPANSVIQPGFSSMTTGVYFLSIQTKQYKTVIRLAHL